MKKALVFITGAFILLNVSLSASAVNWNGSNTVTTDQQRSASSGSYYWGYGLRDSWDYSYGYSNYFNPNESHYSQVTYAGITDRQSVGAGRSTYTEARDKTSGANGRKAVCSMGLGG